MTRRKVPAAIKAAVAVYKLAFAGGARVLAEARAAAAGLITEILPLSVAFMPVPQRVRVSRPRPPEA